MDCEDAAVDGEEGEPREGKDENAEEHDADAESATKKRRVVDDADYYPDYPDIPKTNTLES